jgi:MFS family permease
LHGLRRIELPLLAGVFLDLAGFGMILADVQIRAEALGAPGPLIGFILASTFIVQTLFSPIWGSLSDRWGRKTVFVACTLISAASMGLYSLSGLFGGWGVMLASRIIAGFGSANVAAAQAAIADAASGWEESDRTAAMGRIGAAVTLGLILGPAMGGEVAVRFGPLALGVIAGSLSFIGALVVLLADRLPQGQVESRSWRPPDLNVLRGMRAAAGLLAAAFAAWFSLAMLEGTFGRLLESRFQSGQRWFGLIFAWESVVNVVVQARLIRPAVRRFRERRLLILGLILQGAGLGLTPFMAQLPLLFAASSFYALGTAFASPTMNALASRAAPPERQGELFGLMQSLRGIGFIFGPIIGGAVFDLWMPGPYLIAAAACGIAAVIIGRLKSLAGPAPQAA